MFVELDQDKNLKTTLRNIEINAVFSNFSGMPSAYNNPGDRFIFINLPSDVARKLQEEGWNVRQSERDGQTEYHMKISAGKWFDPESGELLFNSNDDGWQRIDNGDDIDIVGLYWHVPTVERSGFKAYFVDFNG